MRSKENLVQMRGCTCQVFRNEEHLPCGRFAQQGTPHTDNGVGEMS